MRVLKAHLGSYEMKFTDLQEEYGSNPSYLHYVAVKPELLGAKLAATQWLIKPYSRSYVKSCREYMAGVGVQTIAFKERFNIKTHVLSDLSPKCVEHLKYNFDGCLVSAADARKAIYCESMRYDIVSLDLGKSSIVGMQGQWARHISKVLAEDPKLFIWTDTAMSYHTAVHGKRYGAAFGTSITSWEQYVQAYNKWLFATYGYGIRRAAFRKNAIYFCAEADYSGDTQINSFPLEKYSHLFTMENSK